MFILSSHKDGRGASSLVPSFPWPRLPSGSTCLHWFSLFWGQIWNAFKTSQLCVWSAALVQTPLSRGTNWEPDREGFALSQVLSPNLIVSSSIAALGLRSKFIGRQTVDTWSDEEARWCGDSIRQIGQLCVISTITLPHYSFITQPTTPAVNHIFNLVQKSGATEKIFDIWV